MANSADIEELSGDEEELDESDLSRLASSSSDDLAAFSTTSKLIESETMRSECLEKLAEMESQFEVMRRDLYAQRFAQILENASGLNHGDYFVCEAELRNNLRSRLEAIRIIKELRVRSVEHQFKAEQLAIKCELEINKAELKSSLIESLLQETRRQAKEERKLSLRNWKQTEPHSNNSAPECVEMETEQDPDCTVGTQLLQ